MAEINGNLAKITAGFKGGPFFQNLSTGPNLKFAEGVPGEIIQTSKSQPIPRQPIVDVWNSRRGGK